MQDAEAMRLRLEQKHEMDTWAADLRCLHDALDGEREVARPPPELPPPPNSASAWPLRGAANRAAWRPGLDAQAVGEVEEETFELLSAWLSQNQGPQTAEEDEAELVAAAPLPTHGRR